MDTIISEKLLKNENVLMTSTFDGQGDIIFKY